MAQNLISFTISPEVQTKLTQALNDFDAAFTFKVTLTPKQKQKLTKPGDTFLPLIDRAVNAVTEFPKALPGTFDTAEFNRDYELRKALIPLRNKLMELSEAVDNTLFAVTSDAYVETLQVYAAVQAAVDKIPGINQLAAEMAAFCKKSSQDDGDASNTTNTTPTK
jgi:hypothetical protein